MEAVEGEVLGAAALEQLLEADDDGVGCRQVAVTRGEVPAGDVEPRFLAVT